MAELEPAPAGPYTDVSFKLREETSKIVGCVAELCEELVVRRRKPRPDNVKAVSSVLEAPVDDLQAEQDAGASRKSEAIRRSKAGQVKALLGLEGDVELEGEGLVVEEASTCMGEESSVEEAGLDESTKPCLSGRKEEHDSCSGSIIGENGEDADEKLFRLPALELPDVSVDSVGPGYSAVKRDAEEWLARVGELTTSTTLDVPELWSFWKPEIDFFEENYASEPGGQLESQELQPKLSGPRRMQCDWCETFKRSEDFLYDESSRFLKKMVRANAQVLRLKDIAVPDVFEGDWGRALNDSHRPLALNGEELQQIRLPFALVREDDAKVNNAPSKLVSLANSYSRTLQRSDVSLTNASMHIPSVWNLGAAVKGLPNLVAEELKIGETQQKSRASASCNSAPLPAQLVKVTSEKGEHLEDKSTSSPRWTPARNNEASPLSTDYFLSDKFLRCDWSEPTDEITPSFDSREATNSSGSLKHEHLLQQIARPAVWDLMRKKLLQVDGPSFQSAFNRISLETLETIIYQQFRDVKKMSLNPSAFSSIEIVEACSSLRQAAWLHTLRIVSISQKAAAQNAEMMPAVLARIVPSAKYKLIIGASNWKDFQILLEAIGGGAVPTVNEAIISEQEEDPAFQQPQKRRRLIQTEKETTPVRVLCSVKFLEQDELLDELCTEQQVFFIERQLPAPIDMLVDERNCICVVEGATLQVEPNLRSFIFSLARLQVQLQKCWLIIVLDEGLSNELENAMNAVFAALVQFRIELQVLTSFSCEETGRFVRAIIDECAGVALNCHRILPRLWYERPFLLEEESQFERFLVSTTVVNNFAAQSLLHKISIKDLLSKSIEELKLLVQNAVTEEQLQLLWGLLQQDHGLNGVLQ